MEKRKIYGMILGIFLFIILMLGMTYAYFYWNTNETQETEVKLTVNKSIEPFIHYNAGTAILTTDTKGLDPVSDYTGGMKTVIEFWKDPSASNMNIYGELSLEILTMLSATGSTDANIGKTNTLKWTLTSKTSTSASATETLVAEGTFNGRRQGDKFTLKRDISLNTSATYYTFYIWMDAYALNGFLPLDDESMSAEISASASTETQHYGASPLQVLTNLNLNSYLKSEMLDYSAVTTATDSGIYASYDEFGISYYFRGNFLNNYVRFGKNASNKDMYWRIIRINGDGSVRMIYDGTQAHNNAASSSNKSIGNKPYKISPYNHNTYVGYMYGSTSGTNYATIHTNATDSTIKAYIDNWYNNNIVKTGYSGFVTDAIYCNDRSLSSGSGEGVEDTLYGAYNRIIVNKNPSFVCPQDSDKFTTSTLLGNGKLTYPVGLITADEVVMAGGADSTNNVTYYLRSGYFFYTMSAYGYSSSTSEASVFGVNGGGGLVSTNVYTDYTVRPVITLRYDAIKAGTGTSGSPFVVE